MWTALGFDLNGLWDLAVKGDGEGEPVPKDLGIHGSIIRLAIDQTKWVGGVQAALAPHGRGGGWGPIGEGENRVFWADVLKNVASGPLTEQQAEAVISFFNTFVEESTDAHIAVPDAPSFDEPARDRLIRLLFQSRHVRATLLWRPVAAVLGWLEEPADSRGFQPETDMRIGVLSVMGDGIQYADLKLVQEHWGGSQLWVPERSTAGIEVQGDCGGTALAKQNIAAIARRTPSVDPSILSVVNSPWRLAVGERAGFELVRMPNRSWRRLSNDVSPTVGISRADIPDEVRARLAEANALIVEGPMAGNERWVDAVLAATGSPHCPVHRGSKGLVAKGCLTAALRSRAGAPIYYDFLPQLEINAFVGNEPRFVELIPKNQRLRGNTLYRGTAPGHFTIGKGASRPVFYLFKEDLPKGRKAEVELPEAADREHAISVTVEQSPGQGFARVRVTSGTFETLRHHPIELDWSAMALVEDSKEQILKSLSGQTGLSYPDTVATEGHPFLWHPDHPDGNLLQQLRNYIHQPLVQAGMIDAAARHALQVLRDRFSKPDTPSYRARKIGLICDDQGSFRALDSDGSIPAARGDFMVRDGADEALRTALDKTGKELEAVLNNKVLRQNQKLLGDIVGFSTWCFWRCPERVVDLLLKIYDCRSSIKIYHILYREGLGRILHRREDLDTYFDAVDRKLRDHRHLVTAEFAALAKVLGTCSEAAEILRQSTADMILQETCSQLKEENRESRQTAYKRKFKASLLMLAALLRHRQRRRDFIDPNSGFAGRTLIGLLDGALRRNERFREDEERLRDQVVKSETAASHNAAARRFGRNSDIVRELIAMVKGTGSDPNIIRKIDQMEE